jgi:hypothetical protein
VTDNGYPDGRIVTAHYGEAPRLKATKIIRLVAVAASVLIGAVCAQAFDSLLVAALVGLPTVLLVSWLSARWQTRLIEDEIVDRVMRSYFEERGAQ